MLLLIVYWLLLLTKCCFTCVACLVDWSNTPQHPDFRGGWENACQSAIAYDVLRTFVLAS